MFQDSYIILSEIVNFSMKYFIYSKVYTHEGDLYACTGDNLLAKARRLSLQTGGQLVVELVHKLFFFF